MEPASSLAVGFSPLRLIRGDLPRPCRIAAGQGRPGRFREISVRYSPTEPARFSRVPDFNEPEAVRYCSPGR